MFLLKRVMCQVEPSNGSIVGCDQERKLGNAPREFSV